MTETATSERTSLGYRLAAQQRRLWLVPEGAQLYRAHGALLIEGDLRAEALRRAVQKVVGRHEMLRTLFKRTPGLKVPFQVWQDDAGFAWSEMDCLDDGDVGLQARLAEMLEPEFWQDFDFENGPLVQTTLLALTPRRHVLMVRLPALCADSRSLGALFDEVSRSVHNPSADGLEEPVQYSNFMGWQHEILDSQDEECELGRTHWARQDLAALASFSLPGMTPGHPERGFAQRAVVVELEPGLERRLEAMAHQAQTSLRVLLLAAWQILLGRLSGQRDLVVGVVFDGRKYAELDDCIGLLARVLPVPGHLDGDQKLGDFLAKTAEAYRLADEWQEYAFWEELEPELPAAFEFESHRGSWSVDGLSFSSLVQTACFQRSRIKLHCTQLEGRLTLTIQYDAGSLPSLEAELLARRLPRLLCDLCDRPGILIGDLEILPYAERHRVAVELNDSAASLALCDGVHVRFRRQAALTPAAPAVVFEDCRLSYSELDQMSDHLAHRLRALGVGAEDRVALLLERSAEIVVSLLGVLKAGAAYVPLDPALPRPRLAMMVADAGASALIHPPGLNPEGLMPASRWICVDDPRAPETAGGEALELPPVPLPDGLAYVLFTSGSTGRPKGVAIGHRQLLNYVDAFQERAKLPAGTSFATVSTFAADLGNTMVFTALLTGGCLHVVSAERATDADAFASYMKERAVDCLKIVPSHLVALLAAAQAQDVLPRRLVVLGGEAATWRLIERIENLAPHCRILNHYGPTETTVGVTTLEIAPERPAQPSPIVPLGRPLANSRVLLLDERLQLAAPGVAGELYIGGTGLARGYFARPDLTAERFLPSPWGEPGSRLYRTGDLARLLPDGRVEFLGRLDHQVKIHGFRIESREIELALSRQPGVRDALVRVREDIPEEKRLVAYAVPQPGQSPVPEALRAALREELPAYMVPAVIVILATLPLTPNGKVDLQALPIPERVQRSERSYTAPRNPAEEELARIWSAVLGVPRVGIHDNFFELRGDSILAIQVIAAANRAGLVLQPRHLFEHQTISRLAAVVGTAPQVRAEQGLVTGAVPLMPIQHWFFEQGFADPQHWNLSALWSVDETLSPAFLDTMVRRLVEHHDAFRLRFEREEDGWRQLSVGTDDLQDHAVIVDLSALPAGERPRAVEAVSGALQGTLDLGRGPLLRMGLLQLGWGQPNRLLVAVHHLVMDGVSWRILLENMQRAWRQMAEGRSIELPPKSTSFRDWAERLSGYAQSTVAREIAYWSDALPAEVPPLPVDHPGGSNSLASERSVLVSLEADETLSLLEQGLAVYRAQINDFLLTALVRGFAHWTGHRSLLVELEGHGREPLFDDVDLSQTIGWFTTHFPVWLESGAGPGEDLKATKERLRGIPRRGLGYGLLRYLSPHGKAMADLWPEPQVKLNYLGQLDQVLSSASGFAPAPEPRGLDRSPRSARPRLLAVDGSIIGGRLHLRFSYSAALHREESIRALAGHVAESLRELIAHCLSPEAGGFTPSDFSLSCLRQEELDQLLARLPAPVGPQRPLPSYRWIEDIYPASPLQKSLLLHLLSVPGTTVGFEQKSTILQGDFDSAAFAHTWQRVIDRHAILRTAFAWDGLAGPLQVVYRKVETPFELHDWCGTPEAEQIERLRAFLEEDRKKGFDASRPPLMRLALIRLAEDRSCFVWSYSHLLLDAWCRTLVLREVFAFYAAFSAGRDLELPEGRPYRDYISWLGRQDTAAAADYWRRTLAGIDKPTPLWIDRLPDRAPVGEGSYRSCDFQLSDAAGDVVRSFAQQQRITLNTVLLGVWALLLSRYSREGDVLFGSTVAGRPADLPEVESMLGMFINNLPVRVTIDERTAIGPWLRGLQDRLAEMRTFEWCAPDQVREWAGIPGGQPLYESLLLVQNHPVDDVAPADAAQTGPSRLAILTYESRLETNYPVTVVAGPLEPMSVGLFFNARRIDPVLAGRMARHLETLLRGVAGDPDRQIRALSLLTAEEWRQLLADGSGGRPSAAEEARLDQCFAERVRRSPDAVALTSGPERVTFRALGERVDRLAHEVRRSSRVTLRPEDRAGLAVAPLAILQAGEAEPVSLLAALGSRTGVELSHAGLAAAAKVFRDGLGLTAGDRLWISDAQPLVPLAIHLALALAAGVPIAVPPAAAGIEERLRDLLAGSEVTAVLASPAELCALIDAGFPGRAGLRVLSSGPLARGLARELSALGCIVHVLYDPLGTGLPVAGCRLEDSGPPSVGIPLRGVTILLLGPNAQPVPQGIPGEICVGGPYRPGGTLGGSEEEARWIFGPPGGGPPLVRTGELARWRSDGRIEILGALERVDVLPGARVPTGIVEAALRRHPELRDAVVTIWTNQAGDRRLVACVVPDPMTPPSAYDLRIFLQSQLPLPMLPALFVFLRKLPLGPNGEVDHAALPAPESAGSRLQQTYAAPRDPLEVMLVQIWEDLLGIQPIGIRDNFFELGGHSMLAIQLLAALPAHGSRKLSLSMLLQAATVEKVAKALREQSQAQAWSPLVELQTGGPGLPFFCVHPLSGEVFSFRDLAAAMGSSQPFFGLQARIWEDHLDSQGSIEEIAKCYIEAMASIQPVGPYALGGWSFGGLVALEMAQQLHAAGHEVGLLAILDTNLCPALPASERLERFKRFEEKHASLSFEEIWELASRDAEMGPEIELAKRLLRMPEGMDGQMIRRYRCVGEAFASIRNDYRPRAYPGRVTLFRAVGGYVRFLDDSTLGWGEISAGGLEICDVPGSHNDLVYRPHARALANAIKARLPRIAPSRLAVPHPTCAPRGVKNVY